jgi:putative restriction endonuclease
MPNSWSGTSTRYFDPRTCVCALRHSLLPLQPGIPHTPHVERDLDDRLRAAMFAYLDSIVARSGGRVTRSNLESFEFDGRRVPLISRQQGIRKPAFLNAAISMLTTYARRPDLRPYADEIGLDGYPRYKWRGVDPLLSDNVALRRAMKQASPLAWFIGVAPGIFRPVCPVWLVGEEPNDNQFVVAIDEVMRSQWGDTFLHPVDAVLRRQYAERVVRQRLHQPVFRERVLEAYSRQCGLCRLRHPELLDAAHIKEDAEGGEPIVPNGVSMCAIHHRAFDAHVLGIRPDYVIQVRQDILRETDGPTLKHALQGLHGIELQIPRQPRARPDRLLLEERYERFRLAG